MRSSGHWAPQVHSTGYDWLMMVMARCVLVVLGLLASSAASGASLKIPSASGPLTIDGKIEERIWQEARVLPLGAAGFGAPFPAGGETRMVIRGGYVCVSARLAEPDASSPNTTSTHRAMTIISQSYPVGWT